MTSFRGLEDVLTGLLVKDLQLIYVTLEFPGIGAYEAVTFSHLWEISVMLAMSWVEKRTCAAGSGFQKTALIDSMVGGDEIKIERQC